MPACPSTTRLYAEFLYRRQQRAGLLFRDCQRLVNQGRNVFAACMVAHGHADAMITGLTRTYHTSLEDVLRVVDPRPGSRVFGLTMMLARGRTVFIADTTVHELPDTSTLADIATQTARTVARMGFTPRVALLLLQQLRQPAGGQGRTDARRGQGRARPPPGRASSMTARWRPTWRSTPS